MLMLLTLSEDEILELSEDEVRDLLKDVRDLLEDAHNTLEDIRDALGCDCFTRPDQLLDKIKQLMSQQAPQS